MRDPLSGKRVLVVDDEVDICDAVEDMLPGCVIHKAQTYDAARQKLASGTYDVAILDIMGVRGYDLLDEFSTKLPCIMLTAHALTPDDLKRSMVGKAVLYLPKQELERLDEYVREVLKAKEPLWAWLLRRVNFARFFGQDWMKSDELFFRLSEDEVEADLAYWER